MKQLNESFELMWQRVGRRFLPFADAATTELPLSRLLRLSLFQVSVGMATVLLTGTLNRVMIVEMSVPAWLVALMVSLPLVFAPLRALIGHKSDTHRSLLGWRRVPYIWFGSLLQFGGLAIMPFALIILSGDTHGPIIVGHISAALAFLLVGAGLHTTQTAGLALATDIAPEQSRPRVVALLYVMLLLGMIVSALTFSIVLAEFSQLQLIKVIQGAAVATIVFNVIALWRQEVRNPTATRPERQTPSFAEAWQQFSKGGRPGRLLCAIALGSAAFSMQDVLLEPYGGQILNMSVSATTSLTALLAGGNLLGFALAARTLSHGGNSYRLASGGVLIGIFAFSAVIFSDPLGSPMLFRCGTLLIGLGSGLFVIGTLMAAMDLSRSDINGLAIGAWGAVQATATGAAIAAGGFLRDVMSKLAEAGFLGPALNYHSIGYSFVYHIEILLLFFTLIVIGPLAQFSDRTSWRPDGKFGLTEFPG